MWEEKVDQLLSGRLRLVIREARSFVGFNDDIIFRAFVRDDEIQAYYRNPQRIGGLDGGLAEGWMKGVGHVVYGSSCVEVGRLA